MTEIGTLTQQPNITERPRFRELYRTLVSEYERYYGVPSSSGCSDWRNGLSSTEASGRDGGTTSRPLPHRARTPIKLKVKARVLRKERPNALPPISIVCQTL